jgi:hypothetical protein
MPAACPIGPLDLLNILPMSECAVKSVTPACHFTDCRNLANLAGKRLAATGSARCLHRFVVCHTATRPHGPTFAGLQVCWTAFRPSSTTAAHTDYGLAMACHLRTVVSRTPRFQSLVPSASDLGSAMGACKYNGCDSESPTTPARCTVQRFNAQAFRRFGNGARKGGEGGSRCPGAQVPRDAPLLVRRLTPSDSPAGQWS